MSDDRKTQPAGTPERPDRAQLLRQLGAEEHAPVSIDGALVHRSLRPGDAAAVADILSQLRGSDIAVVVRGAGSSPGPSNPPKRADLLLETTKLSGVDDFDPEEGVIHVGAGTRLSTIREAARAAGWELPLDPPGASATLGGILARAAVGPRELGFGPARDCVLGLDVVLADGTVTRCGGRVVKNVTGFDLARLYTGSCGILGVIVGAWLRLRPRPAAVKALRASGFDRPRLLAWTAEAALRGTARAAGLVTPGLLPGGSTEEGCLAWVEFAGEVLAVEEDANATFRALPGVEEVEEAAGPLREWQAASLGDRALRARLHAGTGSIETASAALEEAGFAQLVYPGTGTLYAHTRASALHGPIKILRSLRERLGGDLCFEEMPDDAKADYDAFEVSPDEHQLWSALKQRFDSEGRLNPGRGAGRL